MVYFSVGRRPVGRYDTGKYHSLHVVLATWPSSFFDYHNLTSSLQNMTSHHTQNLEPRSILDAVAELGVSGNGAVLDGEFNGGECCVFKLSFKDKASIAVRVSHPTDDSRDDIIATVQTEVRLLQTLGSRDFHWSPRCCGFSLTFDNPIKYPFIILTWIEGSTLTWDDDFPRQPLRDVLLGQIASIQLSLIICTLENRM